MDYANGRALARSHLGLSREIETNRSENYPHPARGGSRGYALWERRRALDVLERSGSRSTAATSIGCCVRSLTRWEDRVVPYRMAGNAQKRELTGPDQLILGIGLFIYPCATSDELATFIHANGGGVYSRQSISRRCSQLDVSRKKASKESYNAFTADSIERLNWFITLPPPLGVVDVPNHQLIDIDEAGFFLKKSNSKTRKRTHIMQSEEYRALSEE